MSKFQQSAVWFTIFMFLPKFPISHNRILLDFLTDVSHALQNVIQKYHFCALFIFFNFWVLINPLVNIFFLFFVKKPSFYPISWKNCLKLYQIYLWIVNFDINLHSVHRKEVYKLQFWNYKIYVQIPEISSLVYDFHFLPEIPISHKWILLDFLTDVSHALKNVIQKYHFCALFLFFNFLVVINPLVYIFTCFSLKPPL